jgi:hypothetical protein
VSSRQAETSAPEYIATPKPSAVKDAPEPAAAPAAVEKESRAREAKQVGPRIEPGLLERAKLAAKSAGYTDVDEFIASCIEREIQRLKLEEEENHGRYRLLNFGTVNGVEKALVEDLPKKSSRLLAVGDKLGDVTLVKIMRAERSIRLKGPAGHEFTVDQLKTAK